MTLNTSFPCKQGWNCATNDPIVLGGTLGMDKMRDDDVSFLLSLFVNIYYNKKQKATFHSTKYGISDSVYLNYNKLRDKRFIIKDYIRDWPGSCTSSDTENIVSIDLVAFYVHTHTPEVGLNSKKHNWYISDSQRKDYETTTLTYTHNDHIICKKKNKARMPPSFMYIYK